MNQNKSLSLLVSSNGWEYSGLVKISYNENYKTKRSYETSLDSEGQEAPDTIILDDSIIITFDEGFEVIK